MKIKKVIFNLLVMIDECDGHDEYPSMEEWGALKSAMNAMLRAPVFVEKKT